MVVAGGWWWWWWSMGWFICGAHVPLLCFHTWYISMKRTPMPTKYVNVKNPRRFEMMAVDNKHNVKHFCVCRAYPKS